MALAKRAFHSSCQLLKRSTDHLVTKDSKKFKLVAFPEPPVLLPSQIADANRLFARPVRFLQSIAQIDQAPDLESPEVIKRKKKSFL
jgi:hypothetical protein